MCNQTSQILPSWSRKRYFKLASAALRTDNGVEGNFICMKLQFRPQKNAFQSMPARLFDHPFANLGESKALTQVDTPNNLPNNIWTCPAYSIPTNPWLSKTTRSILRKKMVLRTPGKRWKQPRACCQCPARFKALRTLLTCNISTCRTFRD